MLPVDDIISIINRGYSFNDAMKIAEAINAAGVTDPDPAPAPTTDPAPAPAPAPAPTADPALAPAKTFTETKTEAYGPELSAALRDLTEMIRGSNISGVEFPAPVTTQEQADKAIINIINPPRRDKTGG